MAFLDEVRHRQAVVTETPRQSDDEAHVSRDETVQGALVAPVLPADGKVTLFFAGEEGRLHRGSDELSTNARDLRHSACLS